MYINKTFSWSAEEVTVVNLLVGLDIVVVLVIGHDDLLGPLGGLETVPDHSEGLVQPPVQGQQVLVGEDGADGVRGQGGGQNRGQRRGSRVEWEQGGHGRGANHAALNTANCMNSV